MKKLIFVIVCMFLCFNCFSNTVSAELTSEYTFEGSGEYYEPEYEEWDDDCWNDYTFYYDYTLDYYNTYANGGEGTKASPWKIGKENPSDVTAWIESDVLHIAGNGDMMDFTVSEVIDDELDTVGLSYYEMFLSDYLQFDGWFESSYSLSVSYDIPWLHVKENAAKDNCEIDKKFSSVVFDSGSNVTNVGNNAFAFFDMSSVTLQNSVKKIGDYAFYNNQITSVTLPTNLTWIGDYSFYGSKIDCTIEIPTKTVYIGDYAFCSTEIETDATKTLPSKVKYVGDYAFYDTDVTGTLTVSEVIQTIGEHAFEKTKVSGEVVFPDTLTELGYAAFKDLNITKATFKGELPRSILDDEPNLTFCYYPDEGSVSQALTPFYNCPLVTKTAGTSGTAKIHYLSSPTSDYAYAYKMDHVVDTALEVNNIDTNTTALCNFFMCYSINGYQGISVKSLTLPNTITKLGYAALDAAIPMTYGLKDCTIEHIPAYLYDNYLFDFDGFPKGMKTIGDSSFFNAQYFDFGGTSTILTLPDGVTYIGDRAFGMMTFTKIIIPETCEYIGSGAFVGVTGHRDVEVVMPIDINYINSNIFGTVNYKYVSKGKYSLDSYNTRITKLTYTYDGQTVLTLQPGLPSTVSSGQYFMTNYAGTITSTKTIPTGLSYTVYENGVSKGSTTPTSDVAIKVTDAGVGVATKDSSGNEIITLLNSTTTVYKSTSNNVNIEYDDDFLTSVGATSSSDLVFTASRIYTYSNITYGKFRAAYDLSLKVAGNEVTAFNSDKLKVYIPYNGSLLDTDDYYLAHIKDGELIDVNATYDNGYYAFETDHFSVYALTTAPVPDLEEKETADNKSIELKYSIPESYTLVIPTEISLETKDEEVKVEGLAVTSSMIGSGKKLSVYVTSTNSWKLKNGDNELSYLLAKSSAGTQITSGTESILEVEAGATIPEGGVSQDLYATLKDDASYAGDYSDTITFTVSVE